MQFGTSLMGVLTKMGFDFRPVFSPATAAFNVAESQHGVDMPLGPMHPRAFQTHFHHQFVAAFHDSAANRPAVRLKTWILDLLLSFLEIGQVARHCLCIGMLSLQLV